MTDEQKLKLINVIEVQVCGILIENNICEYVETFKKPKSPRVINRFSNMRILEPFASKLGYNEISLEQVEFLRNLYPKGSGRKGTTKTIKSKLTRWLGEFPDYSIEDVKQILKAYVEDMTYTGGYLFNLDNIFYKKEGKFEKIPFQAIAEKYGTSEDDKEESLLEI